MLVNMFIHIYFSRKTSVPVYEESLLGWLV
jgi:hypothetical protein